MTEEVEEAGKHYVAKLLGLHPDVEADLVDSDGPMAEASMRIKPSSEPLRR